MSEAHLIDPDDHPYRLLEVFEDGSINDISDDCLWHLEMIDETCAVLVTQSGNPLGSHRFRITSETPITIERYDPSAKLSEIVDDD